MIKPSQSIDDKTESEQSVSKEPEKDETVPTTSKEEPKGEAEESKEVDKAATTTPALAPPSILAASRNDLIKDIESHIEIIYECLDELNESASSSTLNKTSSNEPISISSETSSLETDNTVRDATETNDEKANESTTTPDESKNEQNHPRASI